MNKPKCIDCGKQLKDYRSKRCRSCEIKRRHKLKILNSKDTNNPNYKTGKYLSSNVYRCIDCGKKITIQTALYGLGRCKSCAKKGNKHPMFDVHRFGKDSPHFGHYLSKETKKQMSLIRGGTGIPYENSEYPQEFYDIRPKILERDSYTCQKCFKHSNEIHHIDYNKQNCNEENLIALCHKCNTRANFDRDYWFAYFTYIMENLK